MPTDIKRYADRVLPNLALVSVAGLVLFLISNFATSILPPNPLWGGFPFPISTVTPGCVSPGGLIGCQSVSVLMALLDFLFWTGAAFASLTLITAAQPRLSSSIRASYTWIGLGLIITLWLTFLLVFI